MSLAEVKQIGRPTGATVNDVALAALAGALREHLAARGSLVEEIRAYMPFNLRPPDEPIPRELGNLFGLVFLTLPIGVEDRRERLACVQQRMAEIKRSEEGRVAFDGLRALGVSPRGSERLCDRLLLSEGDRGRVEHARAGHKPIRLAGVTVKGMFIMAPRIRQRRAGRDDLQLQRPCDVRRQCRRRAPARPVRADRAASSPSCARCDTFKPRRREGRARLPMGTVPRQASVGLRSRVRCSPDGTGGTAQ